jgi:soluble lytic murein transglycosylase
MHMPAASRSSASLALLVALLVSCACALGLAAGPARAQAASAAAPAASAPNAPAATPASVPTPTSANPTTLPPPASPIVPAPVGDAAALPPPTPANAPSIPGANPRDDVIRQARDAFARHDRARLAAARASAIAARHPLAPWVDYWALADRLPEVGADEVEAFFARWPGTYVEDRLRNDWLLELGRRQDWTGFARELPRFRMNDDREVTCYATLIDHWAGKDVHDAALARWLAQRDADTGCQLMAQTLWDDQVFGEEDVARRLRQAAEYGRPRAGKAAAQLLGKAVLRQVAELWDNPAHWLAHRGGAEFAPGRRELLVSLALARMAASDPGAAALQLAERQKAALGPETAAWTWAVIAEHGAQSQLPDAVDWADRAWGALERRRPAAAAERGRRGEKAERPEKADKAERAERPDWSDDALAWQVRAALRSATGAARWKAVQRAIGAMSPAEQADPAWVYWQAQATVALAQDGPEGDTARAQGRAALAGLSTTLNFYGLLAAEDRGGAFVLPPHPVPTTPAERSAAHANPGLQRALALAALDLRDEGRREWNYTLRGMGDRELLAAAQWACESNDWQLCINTSERTRGEIDLLQRYPMPYQRDIVAAARGAGLEPAFVFGLIRQETRFMTQMRSYVGASGLMQLMPATAKWAARKGGIAYRPELISDPATNLRIGTFYLKMVLDSFGGSAPMAAAAYNAGPARPRRWRGSANVDPVIWAENVPFAETRDYVKKVMTNAAIYAALQSNRPPLLRPRLGPQIGPHDAEQPPAPDMP